MKEVAEVNDDSFAKMTAGLVERHPALYYRMVLEDSHIPLHAVKRGFFGDTFLEVFRQYNNALFDSVRLMIRYEKSLVAWGEIVAGVDDKVLRDTLVMDYVHPVLMVGVRSTQRVQRPACPWVCQTLNGRRRGDYSISTGTQTGLV